MIELINEATIQDIQAKYYPDIKLNILKIMNSLSPDYSESQPDRKTNYLPWMANRIKKGDNQLYNILSSDAYRDSFRKGLVRFEQIKNELPEDKRDISKYTFSDIISFVSTYKDYLTQKEKKEKIKEDTRIMFNSSDWMIVIPESYEASKFWGLHTKWCTAEKDSDSYYKNYTSKGPLYINIDKRTNKKWQFHFETNSFCDEEDVKINTNSKYNNKSIAEACNMPEDVLKWYITNIEGCDFLDEKNVMPERKYKMVFSSNGVNFFVKSEYAYNSSDRKWYADGCILGYSNSNMDVIKTIDNFNTVDNEQPVAITYNNGFTICDDDKKHIIVVNKDGTFNDIYQFSSENIDIKTKRGLYTMVRSAFNDTDIVVINKTSNIIQYTKLDNRIEMENIIRWELAEENGMLIIKLFSGNIMIYDLYNNKIITNSAVSFTNYDKYHISYRDNSKEVFNIYFNKRVSEQNPNVNESKTTFWKTLNKINEINKRNCDDRID